MSSVFKKSVIGSAVALGLLAGGQAMAADVSANVGIYNQYVFRGITQTAGQPAIQGGFDVSTDSGFYVGTWGSNISWFSDANAGNSVSMEWDLYGGYRGTTSGALGYDVGVLQYFYPGRYTTLASGVVEPDTTEVYGSLSYKWFTAKLSYVTSNGLFGVDNASGSYYADLSADIPFADTWTANLHVGRQHYAGSAVSGGPTNDSLYSYDDWKVGLTKDLGKGWSATAYYTDTNAKDAGYKISGVNGGNNLGAGAFVVGISRSL